MQKRKRTTKPAIKPLTEPQVESLVVDPNPIVPQSMKVEIVPDSAKEEEGGDKEGGEEVITPVVDINTTNSELTCDDIRTMTVIQIHSLIRDHYPGFHDLLDVYNRDTLQNKFMFKLGL
jgi:hypothetical protein